MLLILQRKLLQIKNRRFSPQLGSAVRIGKRNNRTVVEFFNAPVHGRIAREAGFDGEDLSGKAAETFAQAVKSAL